MPRGRKRLVGRRCCLIDRSAPSASFSSQFTMWAHCTGLCSDGRIELFKRSRPAIRAYQPDMISLHAPGTFYPHTMGDNPHFLAHLLDEVRNPDCLIGWIKSSLKLGIVCRDAGGAGVLVTLHRLDAAQRKHKPARRNRKIGTRAQRPGDLAGGHQFPAGNDPNTILQTRTVAQIDHNREAFAEGHDSYVAGANTRC